MDFIDDKSKKEGINNIKTILVDENGLYLLEKVDMFFLRNVFHHLPEPVEYFKNIKLFLKDDGKVTVIDYEKKGFTFTGFFGYFTHEDVLINIMEKVDSLYLNNLIFLPEQSFILFKMNKLTYLFFFIGLVFFSYISLIGTNWLFS